MCLSASSLRGSCSDPTQDLQNAFSKNAFFENAFFENAYLASSELSQPSRQGASLVPEHGPRHAQPEDAAAPEEDQGRGLGGFGAVSQRAARAGLAVA